MQSGNSMQVLSDVEHASRRSFMTGQFERVLDNVWAADTDGKIYKSKYSHSPALLKILDEPITNSCDIAIKSKRVSVISCVIDINDGEVAIYDDGPGISVHINHEGSKVIGKPNTYNPEFAFGHFRSGTNLEVDDNHSLGGINGLGVKLTNVHSEYFNVRTIDGSKKLLYDQWFSNGLRNIHPPTITETEEKSSTIIRFKPIYSRFQYNLEDKNSLNEFVDITRFRMMYISCYLNMLGHNINVVFQNQLISSNTETLLKGFLQCTNPKLDTTNLKVYTIHASDDKHKMIASIVVTGTKSNFPSAVNGVMVKEGGSHVTHLKKSLNEFVHKLDKDKIVEKGETKLDSINYISYVMCCNIAITNWGAQTKDKVTVLASNFKQLKFEESILKNVGHEILSYYMLNEHKKAVKSAQTKNLPIDKFIPALDMKSPNKTIVVTEGDSAMALMVEGLKSGKSSHTLKNTSLYSLGGVPNNISKSVVKKSSVSDKDEESDAITGTLNKLMLEGEIDPDNPEPAYQFNTNSEIIYPSQKFWKSKTFTNLVSCMGLDFELTYDSEEDFSKLKYSQLVICVDQDLDGRGFICALVLNFFVMFWPNLLRRGYIKQWNSPIIRITESVHSDKVVREFYTEREFKDWYNNKNNLSSRYYIDYIKGLAGHDSVFIDNMFRNFDSDCITLFLVEDTRNMFSIFFDTKYSSYRKRILSSDTKQLSDNEFTLLSQHKLLSCNNHLATETTEFMKYAVLRTLPSAIDGLTPVRRKVFHRLYKINQTDPKKVYQVAGDVAANMFYHHGDASINGAIIKMAHDFPTSNTFPLLKGKGQLGNRNDNGKNSGSPRYISVYINTKNIDKFFSKKDLPDLVEQFDEGNKIEPRYYIPTVPYVLLSNAKAVSYGWSTTYVARDLKAICQILYNISTDQPVPELVPLAMPVGYKGDIYYSSNKSITSVGRFSYTQSRGNVDFHITELPLFVYAKPYSELLSKNEYISSVKNNSTNDVDIRFTITNSNYNKLLSELKRNNENSSDEECLTKFLHLVGVVHERFNLIDENNKLVEFSSDISVLQKSYEMNAKKYPARLQREELFLNWEITKYKNMLRFLNANDSKNIQHLSDQQMLDILLRDKYDKIPLSYTYENIKQRELELSYDYILNMTFRDLSEKSIENKRKKLDSLLQRMEEVKLLLQEKPFAGVSLYRDDLIKIYNS